MHSRAFCVYIKIAVHTVLMPKPDNILLLGYGSKFQTLHVFFFFFFWGGGGGGGKEIFAPLKDFVLSLSISNSTFIVTANYYLLYKVMFNFFSCVCISVLFGNFSKKNPDLYNSMTSASLSTGRLTT